MKRRSNELRPSALRVTDLARTSAGSLRARPGRTALSMLGVAVGITALVAVLGISSSSRADLLDRLGRYGNLLTVATGQTLAGDRVPLPPEAPSMVRRIGPVQTVTSIGLVPGATIRRTAAIPSTDTGGIAVVAADDRLLVSLGASVAHGRFLDPAVDRYPTVVLGASAARLLGFTDAVPGRQADIDGQAFTVIGILAPIDIAPELDQSALIGIPAAHDLLGLDGAATRLYVRTDPDQTVTVRAVLARTVNPASPEAVTVSRASDLLAARVAAKATFGALHLGLAAVALLVGGVGIANVMVVAVLERRSEIGLRRAMGATRSKIAAQFLTEAVALAAAGGIAGTTFGVAATAVTTIVEHWPFSLPRVILAAGAVAATVTGALAGLYPAVRAARLAPTEALRS